MSESEDGRVKAFRAHCMAYGEGVTEEYPWGHPVWKVRGKMFAACSEDGSSMTVKATPQEQDVLIQHPAIRPADYVGRYGWVSIHVDGDETMEMAKDLIDSSFELVEKKAPGKKRSA
jgi:predicted DNA-binding protein (MmcQ/YjbR family)